MWKVFGILIISIFFRFYQLGTIPVSLAHDEIDNIIQAHAFIHTGTDIVGTWNPLQMLPNSGVMAEWGPLINSISALLLKPSLFSAHFTTALLSSIYPLLIWYLLQKLGVSRRIAIFSALLLSISPWHILFSRTTLEQPTSLFFYTLSWIFLTKIYEKRSRKNLILNAIYFTLFYATGFLTYHGYKFSLPLITFIIAAHQSYLFRPFRLSYSIPFIIIGSLFFNLFLHRSAYTTRSSEMVFNQSDTAAKIVDLERRQSLAPEWTKKIFTNKYMVIADDVITNYINLYNPETLFLHGETNGVFSVWKNGYLLLVFAPFLIIGFAEIIRLWGMTEKLTILLLIVSPLTSVIHIGEGSYSFRSAFSLVLLHIIAAYGLSGFLVRIKKSVYWSKIMQLLLIIFTVIGLSYFSYIYYFLSPVTNANAYFFGDRLMANYVRLSQDKKVLVLDPQPRYSYSNILLARGSITAGDISSFNNKFSPSEGDVYDTSNLSVARNCRDINPNVSYDTIVVHKNLLPDLLQCETYQLLTSQLAQLHPLSLVSPQDSGEERKIYGNTVCDRDQLGSYVHPTSLRDFELESMSKEVFCNKWVVIQ